MTRPLPKPTPETRPFWDGCAQGELRYQQCADCGAVQLIPRALCERCHGSSLAWKVSARQGRLLSYTVVHRAPVPAFKADVPYVIAIVHMDEGFRLMANVQGGAEPALAIGQPVRIGFVDVDGTAQPIVQRLDEAGA